MPNAVLIFLLLLTACDPSPSTQQKKEEQASSELTSFSGIAMTIPYRILIAKRVEGNEKTEIEAIIASTFKEIDERFNKWNPASELSAMNRLPAHEPYRLSKEMHVVLERITLLVHLAKGKFDPTVESLQNLWKDKLERGETPAPEEIAALKPSLGWDTLHFENGIFVKEDGRTQLDFGGVAKGLCVDLLIERLQSAHYGNCYVEWGGEIRTIGLHPAGRPWHIWIAAPSTAQKMEPLAHLDLVNCAIATSGDYFQHWSVKTADGQEKVYCHIFNPETLSLLEVTDSSVASASFLASDCFTADALAKVLMLFPSVQEAENWAIQLQASYPEMRCWIASRKPVRE